MMKKFKKAVVSVLVIAILVALSITAFATDTNVVPDNSTNVPENTVTNSTENKVTNDASSNSVENGIDADLEDIIPGLEEKLKEKEKEKNNETTTSVKDKKDTDYETKINEDVNVAENDKDIKYKDTYINGNVFLTTVENVYLENVKVDGDVFIVAKGGKFDNVQINGNVFMIAPGNFVIENTNMESAYVLIKNLQVDDETVIEKEFRFGGSVISFDGEVGRDFNCVTERIDILDSVKIGGKYDIVAEDANISDKATAYGNKQIYDKPEIDLSVSRKDTLLEIATEFVIIIVLSIFILGGFPKFSEINGRLKLRNFFVTFFSGILEIIVIFAIAIGIMVWGYGVGYSFGILSFFLTLLGFGKLIFIVAFGVRMNGNTNKVPRIKAFFSTIFVALIIQAISLLKLVGPTGYIIANVFDLAIGISGFGSLMTVIFSARPREKKSQEVSAPVVQEVVEAPKTEDTSKTSEESSKDIEINKVAINNVEIKKVDDKANKEVETKEEVKEDKAVKEEKTEKSEKDNKPKNNKPENNKSGNNKSGNKKEPNKNNKNGNTKNSKK